MANVQFGTNTASLRKTRLYYTETSTIYEGMPVCYEFGATTNVLGLDKAYLDLEKTEQEIASLGASSTAEGYQNEGKFLRVEDVDADNMSFFAGVVAAGGYCGKAGPKWVDVYEPNGAIVPVRSSLSTTTGVSVLAIRPGVQTFTNPTYGGSTTSARSVALAEETVDRSSTNGLCLAKLDPNMFINQGFGVSASQYVIGAGVTTEITLIPNFMSYKSTQTDGDFSVLRLRGEINGAGGSASWGVLRCELAVNSASQGTPSGGYAGNAGNFGVIFKTGATATGVFNGLRVGCENQDSTPATVSGASVYALSCYLNMNTNAPAELAQMYFASDGSSDPTLWFKAKALGSIGAYASTGNAPALATGDIMIPIKIAASTYYLVALADSGL